MMLTRTSALNASQRDRVTRIREAALRVDGVDPLNEAADLALRGKREAQHLLSEHGYAQLDPADATAQMVVHPDHRRLGQGRALLSALLQSTTPVWVWAFGTLDAAQGFATSAGARVERVLLEMGRAMPERPSEPSPPNGVRLRRYRDRDLEGLVSTNAAAFASHPEQGSWTAADVQSRISEPWWDPAGLIVAVDTTDRMVGFHWTKLEAGHQAGEVYVLGVRPEAAGSGLGRALLQAGLHHLYDAGARQVKLFVDSDQDRATRLYESASFSVLRRDTSYRCESDRHRPAKPAQEQP